MSTTVQPKAFSGMNMTLLQLFGVGPKWDITCGNCSATFTKRLPLIDRPGLVCPRCGAVNVLPIKYGYQS